MTQGISQIRDSLNDAIQEICSVTGGYVRTYHLPLLENRQFYRLQPSLDYLAYPIEIYDRQNKRKLEQTSILTLNREDPWWMQTAGNPLKYIWVGWEYLGIYRVPDTEGLILECKFACIPKPYTADTDPIKLRPQQHRAAVNFALSEYHASRGDANRATEYFKQYLEAIDLMAWYPMQAERQWQHKTEKATGQ